MAKAKLARPLPISNRKYAFQIRNLPHLQWGKKKKQKQKICKGWGGGKHVLTVWKIISQKEGKEKGEEEKKEKFSEYENPVLILTAQFVGWLQKEKFTLFAELQDNWKGLEKKG